MRTLTRRSLIGAIAAALPSATDTGQRDRNATPAASPTPVPPPDFATGVTLYVKGTDASDHTAVRKLIRARVASGDSAICLVIPFTQDRIESTQPRKDAELTPALQDLRFLVREAGRHGIAVMLKPLMDERRLMETGPADAWRGTLQPSNPQEWFANYAALIEPWVQLAVDEGVTWFVIGSEFSSLEDSSYDRHWRDLIAGIRDIVGSNGPGLTYGQNWDRVSRPPAWLDDLDLLSIDAYYPLHGVDDGSPVEALVDAFQEHAPVLHALRERFPGKPLYFTEVGISSKSGLYSTPWAWGESVQGPVNLDSQRTFFEAACQFYGAVGEGLFWWVAYIHPSDDPLNDPGFEFLGKPAEEVANRCSASHQE